MLVKELIEKLQSMPEQAESEVAFADFEPVRAVVSCEMDGTPYVIVTDNINCINVPDADELMHEQQEMDETWAERQAEFYEDCLANGEIPF